MILGEPKPSYYPGYVVGGKHYNHEDFRLRGYKQYWLKEVEATDDNGKPRAATTIRPLPRGTKFSGTIRYKNLTEAELGLLLWCLRLEKGCYQSVGMAKPYGFPCAGGASDAAAGGKRQEAVCSVGGSGRTAQPACEKTRTVGSYRNGGADPCGAEGERPCSNLRRNGRDLRRQADFGTADKLLVPEMEAEGMTYMGEGLSLALDLLEKRKAKYKATGVDYYQPILVVMSDGLPNGNRRVWDEAVECIRALCASRKLSVVAVGIGNDADMEMLARVSPRQRPVRLNGLRFREFFAWLSRSVTNVTASLPGDEPGMDLDALQALSAEPWPEDTL